MPVYPAGHPAQHSIGLPPRRTTLPTSSKSRHVRLSRTAQHRTTRALFPMTDNSAAFGNVAPMDENMDWNEELGQGTDGLEYDYTGALVEEARGDDLEVQAMHSYFALRRPPAPPAGSPAATAPSASGRPSSPTPQSSASFTPTACAPVSRWPARELSSPASSPTTNPPRAFRCALTTR